MTGIKLVSPSHLGTTWQCKCCGMPAPAFAPRLNPTLNASGLRASRRMRLARIIESKNSVFSSPSSNSMSPISRSGRTSRCPQLYGNLFITIKEYLPFQSIWNLAKSSDFAISINGFPPLLPVSSRGLGASIYGMRQYECSLCILFTLYKEPYRRVFVNCLNFTQIWGILRFCQRESRRLRIGANKRPIDFRLIGPLRFCQRRKFCPALRVSRARNSRMRDWGCGERR